MMTHPSHQVDKNNSTTQNYRIDVSAFEASPCSLPSLLMCVTFLCIGCVALVAPAVPPRHAAPGADAAPGGGERDAEQGRHWMDAYPPGTPPPPPPRPRVWISTITPENDRMFAVLIRGMTSLSEHVRVYGPSLRLGRAAVKLFSVTGAVGFVVENMFVVDGRLTLRRMHCDDPPRLLQRWRRSLQSSNSVSRLVQRATISLRAVAMRGSRSSIFKTSSPSSKESLA